MSGKFTPKKVPEYHLAAIVIISYVLLERMSVYLVCIVFHDCAVSEVAPALS